MRLSIVGLIAAAPAALGCTGAVAGADGVDAEPVSRTNAVVAVERTSDTAEGVQAQASARFLRVSAATSTDEALSAVGASLDLPAVGTCAAVETLQQARASAGAPAPVVELVDVGTVSIQAAGGETLLWPRQLPDVTDVVSGVVYARAAADPSALPPSERYLVRVGGPGLAPLEMAAWAPGPADDIRVAGEDAGQVVASGATIDLSWAATSAGDDLVYVDVSPHDVRCVFADTGSASLSTVFLDEQGSLVVHRLHREWTSGWATHGIETAEVRFDFARHVGYTRR
ncbi:MAG TPA: hypothetical protein VMI75_26580 [Polyangiaceae bacterium]|nr:hypothetical protein [Polyangiaceae bacterium]